MKEFNTLDLLLKEDKKSIYGKFLFGLKKMLKMSDNNSKKLNKFYNKKSINIKLHQKTKKKKQKAVLFMKQKLLLINILTFIMVKLNILGLKTSL